MPHLHADRLVAVKVRDLIALLSGGYFLDAPTYADILESYSDLLTRMNGDNNDWMDA